MNIALFGGSFNPIHIGHLITANFVREEYQLKKIIFVPCFINPHKKTNYQFEDANHRLNMIKLSIKDNPYFEVSNYEISKSDISFSIDTIKYFYNLYQEKIYFIIGYDSYLTLNKWKDINDFSKYCEMIVLTRNNSSFDTNYKPTDDLIIHFPNTPNIEISSTDIRKRIQVNKSIKYLTSDDVIKYIEKYQLYK
ncbi:MAG TPA: nicotinate (nicotinamide) nucleotide adenylyltransferase [Ignavibacteriales bacterium]|nr:nicotinate (nicotinamide) nucleotide adenylyltransferase [Ignavibacteriales bacterium]HRR18378.1 nicotinate (nicotinamide) nucleotide adenylyltransferase [Ignavibacteriales bacterium]HRT99143.1 nicotinate (nicotinamide) nucleotide adenylyltransferase [Ignavibacteriales bacterium]